jgi:hypothetical protein
VNAICVIVAMTSLNCGSTCLSHGSSTKSLAVLF